MSRTFALLLALLGCTGYISAQTLTAVTTTPNTGFAGQPEVDRITLSGSWSVGDTIQVNDGAQDCLAPYSVLVEDISAQDGSSTATLTAIASKVAQNLETGACAANFVATASGATVNITANAAGTALAQTFTVTVTGATTAAASVAGGATANVAAVAEVDTITIAGSWAVGDAIKVTGGTTGDCLGATGYALVAADIDATGGDTAATHALIATKLAAQLEAGACAAAFKATSNAAVVSLTANTAGTAIAEAFTTAVVVATAPTAAVADAATANVAAVAEVDTITIAGTWVENDTIKLSDGTNDCLGAGGYTVLAADINGSGDDATTHGNIAAKLATALEAGACASQFDATATAAVVKLTANAAGTPLANTYTCDVTSTAGTAVVAASATANVVAVAEVDTITIAGSWAVGDAIKVTGGTTGDCLGATGYALVAADIDATGGDTAATHALIATKLAAQLKAGACAAAFKATSNAAVVSLTANTAGTAIAEAFTTAVVVATAPTAAVADAATANVAAVAEVDTITIAGAWAVGDAIKVTGATTGECLGANGYTLVAADIAAAGSENAATHALIATKLAAQLEAGACAAAFKATSDTAVVKLTANTAGTAIAEAFTTTVTQASTTGTLQASVIPNPVKQVSAVTVAGTWGTDAKATVTVNGAAYTHTVTAGQTTDQIATALATLVDNNSAVGASATGSVVTITAATFGNPFTVATSVTAAPKTFSVKTKTATDTTGTALGGSQAAPGTTLTALTKETYYVVSDGTDIPNSAGTITCTEQGNGGYLTVAVTGSPFTSAATESAAVDIATLDITPTKIEVDHPVEVQCVGDGTVFSSTAVSLWFKLDLVESEIETRNYILDEPVLETLINLNTATAIEVGNNLVVKATCTAYTDASFATAETALFKVDGATASDTFSLTYTNSSGSTVSVAAKDQFGTTISSIAFAKAGTYYLKCLYTGSTATALSTKTTRYFVTKAVVTGAVDVLQLKDTTNSVTVANQADLTTATASTLTLDTVYTFGLYSVPGFTPASTPGTVRANCTLYSDATLATASTNVDVTATADADAATTAAATGLSAFVLAETPANTTAIAANGQIGTGTISVKFTSAGTYYIKCLHTDSADTGFLAATETTQWFQHKIMVAGAVDQLSLKDTTSSVTFNNQAALSTATATEVLVGKEYTVSLYTTMGYTAPTTPGNVAVACTLYTTYTAATGAFSGASATVTTSTLTGTTVGTAVTNASAFTFGDAASAAGALAADAKIGDATMKLSFSEAGTYYLQCIHTGSADTGFLARSTATQWFQHKITVRGAVDQLYLRDASASVTINNQAAPATATATTLYVDRLYTFGLYTTAGYTAPTTPGNVAIACTAYSTFSATTGGFSTAASVITTSSLTGNTVGTAVTGASAFAFGDAAAAAGAVAANGQVGDATMKLQFTTAGTYYIQCLHTASTDTGFLTNTTVTQWFQHKVTVVGARDILQLKDTTNSVTFANQSDLSTATASSLALDRSYTFGLYTTPGFTPAATPGPVGLACTLYGNSDVASNTAAIMNVTAVTDMTSGSTASASSALTFTETPAAGAIAANGRVGNGTVTVSFATEGTFYLKCLHTGSTDTGFLGTDNATTAARQWFQHKIEVVGMNDQAYFKDTASGSTITIKHVANAATADAGTSVLVDKPYAFGLFATTGFTAASTTNVVGVSCNVYSDVGFQTASTTVDVIASDALTSASTPSKSTSTVAVTEAPTSAAAIGANGQIGAGTITLAFNTVGTYYLKCAYTGSTETGFLSKATTTQYFVAKVAVTGAVNQLAIKETSATPLFTLGNQSDLTSATAVSLQIDRVYPVKLYTTQGFTAQPGNIGVKCTAYTTYTAATNTFGGAETNMFTLSSCASAETCADATADTITYVDGAAAAAGALAANAAIGDGSFSVKFNVAGTFYLKCLHTDSADTGFLGTNNANTSAQQWFQTKIVVSGAVDKIQLKATGLTLSNQADLTSATAVSVTAGTKYTMSIYTTAGYTAPGTPGNVAVKCTLYSTYTATTGAFGSATAGITTTSIQSAAVGSNVAAQNNFEFGDAATAAGALAAGAKIGDATVELAISAVPGTYYMQCLHTGTTDTGFLHGAGATTGNAGSSVKEWFQVKINLVSSHVLALKDATNSITLQNIATLSTGSAVQVEINKTYTFTMINNSTASITPTGTANVKVTCTANSDAALSTTTFVSSSMTAAGTANSGAFELQITTANTATAAGADFAATSVTVQWNQPGTFYLKCVVGTNADAVLAAVAPVNSYFQTKVHVNGQDNQLNIREAPFAAVAGTGGSNDLRPFARSTGDVMTAGTLLSSPLTTDTTVLSLVGKTYAAGSLVQLFPSSAPTSDVLVDCLSSRPEVLADIYGIVLPSGSTAAVNVEVPSVTSAAYVQPTEVTYNCAPVTTTGVFNASAVVPFKLYVTPKFRITGGTAAGTSVSGATLNGSDMTLTTSAATDTCKVMSMYEGAALGSNVVKLTSAINPGTTNTVQVTCLDTTGTAAYRIYPSGAAATTYVKTVNSITELTDLVIDQTATGNAGTAALIAPGGTDVTTVFKCSVTSLDADANSTNNSDFATDDEVYFAMTVKRVTLTATWTTVATTSGGVTSIVEGQSPQLTVTRSDGSTSGTYTCSTATTTAGGAAFGTITAATFGSPITLTAATTQDVTQDTVLEVKCQPVSMATTDVVYGDASIGQDSVTVSLTVKPQKLVAYAKGAAGLTRYSDMTTAIAPTTNVDISAATDTKFQGFVGEESHNAGTALVQVGMNADDATAVTGETVRCTVDRKHFLPKDITSFTGATNHDLLIETATVADGTDYTDVTADTKVTFTCKAVTATTADGVTTYADKKIGRIAAGESVTFSIWVAPITPKFVLNTSGRAVTSAGVTKTSGDLASTDKVTLVEGQAVQNIVKLALNRNASTTSNVKWTCTTLVGGATANVLSAAAIDLTGVTSAGSNVGFDDATFAAYAVGPSGIEFTLRCVYSFTGTGTAPTNVGGITIGTSVETTFSVSPKFPTVVAGSAAARHPLPSQITTTPTTISAGALGNLTENTSLSAFDAMEAYIEAQLDRIDAGLRLDATLDELEVEYLVSAVQSCPVVYAGAPKTTALVKLQAPQNLGAAAAMTCRSDDTTVLADIAVASVSETKDAFTTVEIPITDDVEEVTLVTYTCTYDADVTTGTGTAIQVHVTGGAATTESVKFTVVVAPAILVTANGSGARGLTRTTQAYDMDISGVPTSTPVLVAGSAATAAGAIFTLALNVALDASETQPTVNCVSSAPAVLADINGITMNNTTAVATIVVPAPAADAPDTLVLYTCDSTDASIPVQTAYKLIQVVAPSIRAVGGKASIAGVITPARSAGRPGLPGDELDNEYIDLVYSPVAGLVDLAPVVVEGQETASGQVASILLPVASTAVVTVACTSSLPGVLASFEAAQAAAGTTLPLTIPRSSPIDEPVMVDYTCAVKETAGGYAAGISTSFTVNLRPLAIEVYSASDVLQTRPAFTVNEGVASAGLFKVGLNGLPGTATIVECAAPDATVFKSATSSTAFSFNTTFSTAATAVAVDLPASQNVTADTVVAITCKVVTQVATPAPTTSAATTSASTATPAATTAAPATTAPAGTTAPATTAAPTAPPATIDLTEVVVVRVTVRAGKLVAKGGSAARSSAYASLSGVTLSDSAIPVVSLRKRDLANVVTVTAPYIDTSYVLTCSSASTSTTVVRTPGGTSNEYTVTASGAISVTIPGPLKEGDATITCQPKDATEGAKGLVQGESVTFKVRVEAPAMQILTGSATATMGTNTLAAASDFVVLPLGTDVTGSGDLTRTLVVTSEDNPASTALHMRLKAAVSTTTPTVTCASNKTTVMSNVTVSISSSTAAGHGNRNATMTGSIDLPQPAAVTEDTVVTYTCTARCDVTSATLGSASFDVWVPAPQFFVRSSGTTKTRASELVAATTVAAGTKVTEMYIGADSSQTIAVHTTTVPTGSIAVTCVSDKPSIKVGTTNTATITATAAAGIFYKAAAVTLTVNSTATVNETATVVCTPDLAVGSYTTAKTFSFGVRAEPQAKMTAVAGTRNAAFKATAPVPVTKVTIEAIDQGIAGLVALYSSGSSKIVGCLSSDLSILDDIYMNDGVSVSYASATVNSPAGDFEHAVSPIYSYTTYTTSSFVNTNRETMFQASDLIIPAPKAVGTVVYTCQEFTATTATAMGVPAVTQTITEASFEVEVVGRVTGTAPPANVTIVSFRLGLTFDETPSPAVKQEVFTAVSAQTKTTLQTTAPGAGVDVFVREDAGRRRLASVALNLIVDVVVSDATRATDVQTGVSGANEALVLDAIVFALNNPAEGSALAAISPPTVAVTSSATVTMAPTPAPATPAPTTASTPAATTASPGGDDEEDDGAAAVGLGGAIAVLSLVAALL